ncbi:homeobox protein 4-like [Galleria mellonella]|uniref:Homeobox protein 4-like n=1 Tax=Galleria mellonella TaxID=7137 RepID=A0A6J1WRS9_GALME|nr:homeobox protein 4-like [Galleria mellonella]
MDKKTNKPESDRKFENKILKDRGDNTRKRDKSKTGDEFEKPFPDRGDTDKAKDEKNKPNDRKVEEFKTRLSARNLNFQTNNERNVLKKMDKSQVNPMHSTVIDRRTIKEKYTFNNHYRAVNNANNNNNRNDVNKVHLERPLNSDLKTDRSFKKINEAHNDKNDSSDVSKKSENNKPEKVISVQKRPIINTVICKNDATKVYKAVTFAEHRKRQKLQPIQINIPNDASKKSRTKIELPKNQTKTTLSRISVQEKPISRKPNHKKRERKFKNAQSPDPSLRNHSPPTEVAKWAPNCINSHTKQYYEAWVDTTLAAVMKRSEKDKLFLEKQRFLETFQRALAERPITPDLIYENLTDERYIGRIRVRQK